MPNTIGKNLHLCFTALKRELPSSNTNPSSPSHHNSPSPSPSPSTVLVKTFNSLYDSTTTSKSLSHRTTTSSDDYFSTSDFSDTDGGPSAPSPPDFATVFASQRFFFSSPGRSNSIIDTPPQDSHTLVAGGVPISTYSPDPYSDFRRSMQEMVDAHSLSDVASDWDFLHELLLCYLELNPKYAHKFIIGAFADLLVSLTNSSPPDGVRRKPDISDRCTASLCHLNSRTHKD